MPHIKWTQRRYIEIFTPKKKDTKIFSNAHRTFSKIDHMIGHKTGLNTFKRAEFISSIFSDDKGLNLETTSSKHKNIQIHTD